MPKSKPGSVFRAKRGASGPVNSWAKVEGCRRSGFDRGTVGKHLKQQAGGDSNPAIGGMSRYAPDAVEEPGRHQDVVARLGVG